MRSSVRTLLANHGVIPSANEVAINLGRIRCFATFDEGLTWAEDDVIAADQPVASLVDPPGELSLEMILRANLAGSLSDEPFSDLLTLDEEVMAYVSEVEIHAGDQLYEQVRPRSHLPGRLLHRGSLRHGLDGESAHHVCSASGHAARLCFAGQPVGYPLLSQRGRGRAVLQGH